ncbi:MAG: hypothetical protein JXA30_23190 [Deltaproteobacteria bacterium]|nr:hypothetical protein [Deltaproteobacteria bacterium]
MLKRKPGTNHLLYLLLFSCHALLFGCATGRADLIEQGKVKLMIVPSDTHALEKNHLYQEDGELVVYGKVRNIRGFCVHQGHIDLVIIDSEGRVIRKARIPYVDRGKRRKGWRGAHFRARFRQRLRPGSVVRLAFDDENCSSTFHEDHNLAMPLKPDSGVETLPQHLGRIYETGSTTPKP